VAGDGKKIKPERDQTDESLRTERKETDRALADRQLAAEEDADLIVRRARKTADAVLVAAREKADQQLDARANPGATRTAIAEERGVEDETLRDERAAADESLRMEREENALALSRLLPLERDKTDRFLLTERARSDDAVSYRDDFLGIVSHDLRNLLAGIVLSAGLLSKIEAESDDAKQTRAGMLRIQRYAARMNRLIGDLVDVASIDAGKLSVTPLPGDSRALVVEAVDLFQAAASAKGIALEIEMLEAPLPGAFDHDRMLQVFANLITNAIKFTDQGGRIAVQGERAGDGLRFCISDNGTGIPAGMLDAVFERFWQLGKNDKRGLGLGLYISKCIVLAHGGTIWAESKLGEGSRFWFTLPGGERAHPAAATS
jgi:signal transduction histidine kinase